LAIWAVTTKKVPANTGFRIHFHMEVRAIVPTTATLQEVFACWHLLWAHIVRQCTVFNLTMALYETVEDQETLVKRLEKLHTDPNLT
jgi:hypothetical protein